MNSKQSSSTSSAYCKRAYLAPARLLNLGNHGWPGSHTILVVHTRLPLASRCCAGDPLGLPVRGQHEELEPGLADDLPTERA